MFRHADCGLSCDLVLGGLGLRGWAFDYLLHCGEALSLQFFNSSLSGFLGFGFGFVDPCTAFV